MLARLRRQRDKETGQAPKLPCNGVGASSQGSGRVPGSMRALRAGEPHPAGGGFVGRRRHPLPQRGSSRQTANVRVLARSCCPEPLNPRAEAWVLRDSRPGKGTTIISGPAGQRHGRQDLDNHQDILRRGLVGQRTCPSVPGPAFRCGEGGPSPYEHARKARRPSLRDPARPVSVYVLHTREHAVPGHRNRRGGRNRPRMRVLIVARLLVTGASMAVQVILAAHSAWCLQTTRFSDHFLTFSAVTCQAGT